jgi:hypothetical protein
VECTFYNPNIEVLVSSVMMVETPATGAAYPYQTFIPLDARKLDYSYLSGEVRSLPPIV